MCEAVASEVGSRLDFCSGLHSDMISQTPSAVGCMPAAVMGAKLADCVRQKTTGHQVSICSCAENVMPPGGEVAL